MIWYDLSSSGWVLLWLWLFHLLHMCDIPEGLDDLEYMDTVWSYKGLASRKWTVIFIYDYFGINMPSCAYMSADMNRWMPNHNIMMWFMDRVCWNLIFCKLIYFWQWSGLKPQRQVAFALYIMIWFSTNMLTVKAWMDILWEVSGVLHLFFTSGSFHWILFLK